MNGFKNIDIKNFRGIDHLEIDDFSCVNLFLGQNSTAIDNPGKEDQDLRLSSSIATKEPEGFDKR